MRTKSRKGSGRYWISAIAVVLLGWLALAILRSERLPTGPVDIVWDREACAHCRMHVSEPRFAAQVQLTSGDILNYDDPGCLLRHIDEQAESDIHAIWFHHVSEDRWLASEEVGFRKVEPTPMGFGLGATVASEPGAIGYEQARGKLRSEAAPREVH